MADVDKSTQRRVNFGQNRQPNRRQQKRDPRQEYTDTMNARLERRLARNQAQNQVQSRTPRQEATGGVYAPRFQTRFTRSADRQAREEMFSQIRLSPRTVLQKAKNDVQETERVMAEKEKAPTKKDELAAAEVVVADVSNEIIKGKVTTVEDQAIENTIETIKHDPSDEKKREAAKKIQKLGKSYIMRSRMVNLKQQILETENKVFIDDYRLILLASGKITDDELKEYTKVADSDCSSMPKGDNIVMVLGDVNGGSIKCIRASAMATLVNSLRYRDQSRAIRGQRPPLIQVDGLHPKVKHGNKEYELTNYVHVPVQFPDEGGDLVQAFMLESEAQQLLAIIQANVDSIAPLVIDIDAQGNVKNGTMKKEEQQVFWTTKRKIYLGVAFITAVAVIGYVGFLNRESIQEITKVSLQQGKTYMVSANDLLASASKNVGEILGKMLDKGATLSNEALTSLESMKQTATDVAGKNVDKALGALREAMRQLNEGFQSQHLQNINNNLQLLMNNAGAVGQERAKEIGQYLTGYRSLLTSAVSKTSTVPSAAMMESIAKSLTNCQSQMFTIGTAALNSLQSNATQAFNIAVRVVGKFNIGQITTDILNTMQNMKFDLSLMATGTKDWVSWAYILVKDIAMQAASTGLIGGGMTQKRARRRLNRRYYY